MWYLAKQWFLSFMFKSTLMLTATLQFLDNLLKHTTSDKISSRSNTMISNFDLFVYHKISYYQIFQPQQSFLCCYVSVILCEVFERWVLLIMKTVLYSVELLSLSSRCRSCCCKVFFMFLSVIEIMYLKQTSSFFQKISCLSNISARGGGRVGRAGGGNLTVYVALTYGSKSEPFRTS